MRLSLFNAIRAENMPNWPLALINAAQNAIYFIANDVNAVRDHRL